MTKIKELQDGATVEAEKTVSTNPGVFTTTDEIGNVKWSVRFTNGVTREYGNEASANHAWVQSNRDASKRIHELKGAEAELAAVEIMERGLTDGADFALDRLAHSIDTFILKAKCSKLKAGNDSDGEILRQYLSIGEADRADLRHRMEDRQRAIATLHEFNPDSAAALATFIRPKGRKTVKDELIAKLRTLRSTIVAKLAAATK